MSGIYRNNTETTNVRYAEIWIALVVIAGGFLVYSIYMIISNVASMLTRALQM